MLFEKCKEKSEDLKMALTILNDCAVSFSTLNSKFTAHADMC